MRRGREAREQRKQRAQELAKERADRTHAEQLARLDTIFGEGLGAKKERARLAQLIEAGTAEGKKAQKKNKVPRTRSDRRKAKAKKHAERKQQEN